MEKSPKYHEGFHDGYQSAMTDMADAYELSGIDGMLEWLENNKEK